VNKKEKDKFLKDFGKHLRKVREEKGYSVREMQLQFNIDRSNLTKIERGEKNLNLTTLKRIIEALGLSWQEFFEGMDA